MQRSINYISGYIEYPENKRPRIDEVGLINMLPVEVIRLIVAVGETTFGHPNFVPDKKYIFNTSLISKKFRTAIDQLIAGQLNTGRVGIYKYFKANKDAIHSFISRGGRFLQIFSMDVSENGFGENLNGELYSKDSLIELIDYCPNLQYLDLENTGVSSGKYFKNTFSKITKLKLGCDKIRYKDLSEFGIKCPKINKIDINAKTSGREFFDAIQKYFKALTKINFRLKIILYDENDLSFQEIWDKWQNWISSTCDTFENIKSFRVSDSWFKDDGLIQILKRFPNLEKLHLNNDEIKFEGITNKGNLLPVLSMKEINFSGARITEYGLCEIIHLFPNLVTLNLSFGFGICSDLSENAIVNLARLTKLQTLYIELKTDIVAKLSLIEKILGKYTLENSTYKVTCYKQSELVDINA